MSNLIPQGPLPLKPGASRNLVSRLAWESAPRRLGLPTELPQDWQKAFLNLFKQSLERYRSFRLFLETCNRCGACVNSCPYYHATGDPLNIPAARADLARGIYLAHFIPENIASRLPLDLARPLDLQTLIDWHTYFQQCSLCRRCAAFCPLGIDTSEITFICREILAGIGVMSGDIAKEAANSLGAGNALGITPQAWEAACQGMEAELRLTTGEAITCPVDEYGAEVLLIPPAGDLTTHQATFMGYAKAFHAAGISWTTSTALADAANPGVYLGYVPLKRIAARVVMAVRALSPRHVVWGESGHGWRVAANWLATLGEPFKNLEFLKVKAPLHICEFTSFLLRRGAFRVLLDKEANDQRVVTYHDPCHLARSTSLIEEPRELIRACCNFFTEMPASTIGQRTWCCGGGGGLSGAELKELRLGAFAPRARALKRVVKRQGVNYLATACDGCKNACQAGSGHYGLGVTVGGVHELLGQALFPAWPLSSIQESPA